TAQGFPQGAPRYWTENNGTITIWPATDGGYMLGIDYFKDPPDRAALTDVPLLPAVYHDVLVWGVIQELAFRERDIWGQELSQGYFQTRYKQMQEENMLRQRQSSSRVKKSGFYNDSAFGVIGGVFST